MKNNYCKLTQEEIAALNIPNDLKGLLLSPFQHNLRNGYVLVPEDSFAEFVAATTAHAQALSAQSR